MKQVFNAALPVQFIVRELRLETEETVVIACVLILIWTVVFEGVKFAIAIIRQKSKQAKSKNSKQWYMIALHSLDSFLHIFQVFGGYMLMLIACTMNGWLFSAIILGLACGYFLYGWTRIKYTVIKKGEDDTTMCKSEYNAKSCGNELEPLNDPGDVTFDHASRECDIINEQTVAKDVGSFGSAKHNGAIPHRHKAANGYIVVNHKPETMVITDAVSSI